MKNLTQSERPNVLLIMTDQHRGDCLRCDGNPALETPNLDELAANGVRFSRAYSAVPSCIPARAILMTGQSPWHVGILGMGEGQTPMRSDYAHTLPGELARAGYHTQLVGKMHFHPPRALNGFHNTILDEHDGAGIRTDYQAWFEEHCPAGVAMREHGGDWNSMIGRPFHLPEYLHPTNWTVRESVKFLDRRDPTKPFFLCTSFIRPHSPYDPPQCYWDMYINRELPAPVVGDWAGMHDRPEDAVSTTTWRGAKRPEEVHRARAGYYGSVTHIDHQIGWLLEQLRRRRLLDNTLVIFASDHGDMLGDHFLWRKTYAYEGSARIPLLVRFPRGLGMRPGQVCDRPVELRDIMATVLDVCGVEAPPTMDGRSLTALARGGAAADWRQYVHGEHCASYSPECEVRYVTDGKRKYLWFPRLGAEQFFDLEADPGELHDLSANPEKRAEMETWRQRLVNELAPRNVGLTRDGKLLRQTLPIVSPWRDRPRRVGEPS